VSEDTKCEAARDGGEATNDTQRTKRTAKDLMATASHGDWGCTGTPGILVLACDGVFDVMSDQECIDFVVKKYKEVSAPSTDDTPPTDGGKSEAGRDQYLATALARALVQEAIRRSTRDNVTAVVAIL
jgi:hypothetical protein